MDLPLKDRPYEVFISYSHQDSSFVEPFARWLVETTGLAVWWDESQLAAGSVIQRALPDAMKQSRAVILVVSQASVSSGWVDNEFGVALAQRSRHPDFRIIGCRLDDAEPPDLIQTTKWIEVPASGRLPIRAAAALLETLCGPQAAPLPRNVPRMADIYVSRSWHSDEAAEADATCRSAMAAGFRLVGDVEDNRSFSKERVRALIAGSSGLLAILPNRGEGRTSRFILSEIELARELRRPYVLVADSGVEVPPEVLVAAVGSRCLHLEDFRQARGADELADLLREDLDHRPTPPHAFLASTLADDGTVTSDLVCRVVEAASGVPCLKGVNLGGQHAQQEIIELIRTAEFMLADITNDSRNTLIEAGVARGVGIPLHLFHQGPPQKVRFMFQDLEVNFYDDETDYVGTAFRLARRYQRRILNVELSG